MSLGGCFLKAYAMDVKYPVMIVGTAERHILIFDLQRLGNPVQPVKVLWDGRAFEVHVECFLFLFDVFMWVCVL